jgi:superfamily II DNA/RNA helicase
MKGCIRMNFSEFSLSKATTDNLLSIYKISEPNEVQIKSYNVITAGRDLIVASPTGSGKTLAYLLPLTVSADLTSKNVQVMIIAPSQELCIQINKILNNLYDKEAFADKSAVLIGDGNIQRQVEQLKKKPVFVIGTPGRIKQLIESKKLRVHDVKTLVFDEADKLFDKNNLDNMLFIRKSCMKRTQVLLFSASISNKTIKQANDFAYNPVIYDLNKTASSAIPGTIKHFYVVTDRRERIETLRKIVKALECKKAIIFINSRYDLDETSQKLEYHHYNVASISGTKDKAVKKKAIVGFSSGDVNFLLSTDVSARGLQFDNIDTVVNLNLPEDTVDYQHRAGRCGRNGNTGICISIITENELPKIKKLQKEFGINMIKKKLYNGKLVSG